MNKKTVNIMVDPVTSYVSVGDCRKSNVNRERFIYTDLALIDMKAKSLYIDACETLSYHHNIIENKKTQHIVDYINYAFIACILIFFCGIGLVVSGVNNMLYTLFYYCCCHFLIKHIIDWRNGQSVVTKIKNSIDERMKADEELAEVIGQQINELTPEELGDVSHMNEKELADYKEVVKGKKEKEF
jgi:uncharacterized membrane protein